MSGTPPFSLPAALTEFFVWLTTKTEQGRIRWQRQSGVVTVTLKDLIVRFDLTSSLSDAETWRTFTICTVEGDELLRVTPLSPSGKSSLLTPLETLFRTASGRSRIH